MQKYIVSSFAFLAVLLSSFFAASAIGQTTTIPAWVTSLPLLQWYQIPNTKLSDVAPTPQSLGITGPASKIIAWNGAALKRQGSVYMLGAAGGHEDYAGNEVDALQLNTETPRWVELSPPTPNSQIIDRSQFYLDLKPGASHTYSATQFINARNRMIVVASPGMDFVSGLPPPPANWPYTDTLASANGSVRSFSFNFATNTWDKPDYFASYTGDGDYIAALVAKHPVTEDVYYSRNYGGGWWRWTQATNTWSKLSDSTRAPWFAGAAIDPIRNRMLIVGGYVPAEVRDLSGTRISASFGGLGAAALQLGDYTGVIYDEVNDVFLVIYNNLATGNISVLRVDAATWFVDALPITGIPPTNRENGIHNSVQYVPELGGIVIANSYTDNVMFMRTSTGGSRLPPPLPVETIPLPTPTPISTVPPAPAALPTTLAAVPVSSSQIDLSWTASAHNIVAGYRVYRDGAHIATTTGTTYSSTGLASSTAYAYTVSAVDGAGGVLESASVSATTRSLIAVDPQPAPTMPVGSVVTSFTLLSPVSQSAAPFAIGQPFRQGDIPSGLSIVASIPNVQATIKSRWPDDSVKFAILAGQASIQANTPLRVDLRAGTPATSANNLTEQDLLTKNANMLVSFQGVGAVELSSLIGQTATFDAVRNQFNAGKMMDWIQGPEMSSWIYCSPLGSDLSLTAWFEVRLWKDGQIEILPWIENGYLNKAGVTEKNGTAGVSVSGTQRFSMGLQVFHHTRTPLVSGAVFSYWMGPDPQLTFKHDTLYFQQTRLVPTYGVVTPANSTTLSNLATSFIPFGIANYPAEIGATGYHPSIGLLPEWDVLYLTSAGDPRALAAVIINAYSAGRYGIHYRDEKTNRTLNFSSYPNLVINNDVNSGISSTGASTVGAYTPVANGGSPPAWTTSHAPSVGYLAYLLHGRFYFMEETQFAATLVFLKQTDSMRQFAKGILLSNAGANTTRGAGWGLRTYTHAELATPDNDPLKLNFSNVIDENISYYHAQYVAKANNPQGVAEPYEDYTAADNIYMHSIWMEDFLTAAFGYILDAKAFTAISGTKAVELFNWKAKSIVERLGQAGVSTEYDFRDAAAYIIAVAPSDSADWGSGAGPWYANWGENYRATLGVNAGTALPNQLRGGNFPGATSYWGNLQPAIAYAVTNNVPGAAAAYARMTGASNWPQFLEEANSAPVWSVIPSITPAALTP